MNELTINGGNHCKSQNEDNCKLLHPVRNYKTELN